MRQFEEAAPSERAAFAQQATRALDNLKLTLRRELSAEEVESVTGELITQYEHEEPIDGLRGYWNAQGARPDTGTRQGKVAQAEQRLAAITAAEKPASEEFDTSTRRGRLDYAFARWKGAEAGESSGKTKQVVHRPMEAAANEMIQSTDWPEEA